MSELREGLRVSNYLLEERIGGGSFGEVWRAKHHVFGDIVAIKVPTDPQYVHNLQREGVAVHGLKHPNIVKAIDLDPYGEPPYFVMEYVDGPSLRAVIDERGPEFPIPAAVSIMRGILQALLAAHEGGLIHRDVKPANILLHQPPEDFSTISERAVKVTDFGLGVAGGVTTQSIMQSGSMLTDEGRSIAGTIAYMSPEQKEGEPLDPRSDLYACGIILFEMLTGERPQGSDWPSSLRSEVPEELDQVFRSCYTHRDRRYASAREMLAGLSVSVSESPGAVPPPPPAMATTGSESNCCSCGRRVHKDDQFCIYCGHQLVARVAQCSSCEAYVRPGDRFCIFCGNDLCVLQA